VNTEHTSIEPHEAPPPPERTTPSAEDVREMTRAANRRTIALIVPLLALVVGTVWYAAGTRAGAQDSFNATDVFLAGQPRSACITERRNEQLAAQGQELAALGRALIAAFITGDDGEALRQVSEFEKAARRQDIAAASVAAEVLNLPPAEGGCGPPIDSLEDLPEDD